MNKLFLILLPATLDRDEVIRHLETNRAINFWFYSFPSSFFVRSQLIARQLQEMIVLRFNIELIFVIQINGTTDLSGIVPDEHAQLFNGR